MKKAVLFLFLFLHVARANIISDSVPSKEGMMLHTFLFEEHSYLSQRYLVKSEEYFSLYKSMFGFLPFDSFSVIESDSPVGYSMPAYTVIGSPVIDKEFVLEGSLGHEIAHQYFGNYVFAPGKGNWSEAVTTYYADYLFAKTRGEGARYRKEILLKYDSYVREDNEITLMEFAHKETDAKNAIGYDKGAFFFYMLENKIGKEALDRGTKTLLQEYRFKSASYEELKEIYERASKQELDGFFTTWVHKKGAFEFDISDINLTFVKDSYVLEFDISTNSKVEYLPLSVCSLQECVKTKLGTTQKRHRLELGIEPVKIVADEDYEIFRRLHPDEIPPLISKIKYAQTLVVVDKERKEEFFEVIKMFKHFKYSDELSYNDIKNNDLLILGTKNSVLEKFAIEFEMRGDAKIEVFKNPLSGLHVAAVLDMQKPSKSIFYRLGHLGKYSLAVFKEGKILNMLTKPSANGAVYEISDIESTAIECAPKKLSGVISDIAKNRVVYIGENHTEFSSHINQLKIIKAMYENDKNLSIGMEMFQKSFQEYLDKFIKGDISEKEMLKRTEYFKRWSYDYELYRPILLFAREKSIPLVALNIDREITKKVVGGGLDSLGHDELLQIPKTIDFGNVEYRKLLMEVYEMHKSPNFKNFEEFYHAQLLWDESMAHNVAEYLQKNPSRTMAVLAGNGHVIYGYGIPQRAKRRGVKEYVTVLNTQDPKAAAADYILFPSSMREPKTKKLGIYFESKEKLHVAKLVEGSPAQKAKVESKDVILAIDGVKVNDIYEIKTELVFVQNSASLTLLRDGKELEAKVEF